MFESIAAILFFGFSIDASQTPIPNKMVGVPDKKACIIMAKDMAKRFEMQYPTGAFIAECRDDQHRTYFRIQNSRSYIVTRTEVV